MFAGVAQAYADSTPVLVLPQGAKSKNYRTFPSVDVYSSYREITKWAETIRFSDQTPEIMRRAFTYLKMGRPRPVLVDIPSDVMGEEFDDALFNYKPVKPARPEGDPDDVKKAAKILIAAKNPVIRAGQGVLYATAWDELRELAELLQIPVSTTMNGKSAFPENHPLSLGAGGWGRPDTVPHSLNKADVVFAIGSSCTKESFTYPVPAGKTLIQTTIDELDINKHYSVEQSIIGDARLVLRQLIDEVKKEIGSEGRQPNNELITEIKAIKEEWLKKWMPKVTSDEIPINPYRVYWDLMNTLDRNKTIMSGDSGSPRDSLTALWETLIPGGFIGFGKDHMLGAGMGLAMGAKLARPELTVVNVGGDGAFGEVGMDWETAVRERIPIIKIVLNNGTLGGTQRTMPIASKEYGLDRLSGDYSKVAEALGSYAERVEQPGDIIPAIQRAKNVTDSGKPAFLEFMTKEDLSIWQMVRYD